MIKTIVAILNYLENVDVTAGIACATIVSVWFRSKKDPGKMGGVKDGVGEGGWGGGWVKGKNRFFLSPPPPFSIFWFSIHLLHGQKQKSRSSLFHFTPKPHGSAYYGGYSW